MKRFIVTTILTAVIASVLTYFMPRSFETYLNKFGCDATVTISCRQTDLDSVDTGFGVQVQCLASDFSATAAKCQNVDGVSVSFDGCYEDVLALIKFFKLQVSSEFEQGGLYAVSGKSSKISGGVTVDGKVVNLQIAYKDGLVHLGSPLILGDY